MLKGSSRAIDDIEGMNKDLTRYLHDITSENEEDFSKDQPEYSVNIVDPPISTTITPPRSLAMGSRTSFRVSQPREPREYS
jgi:hypothetical protein